MKKLALLLCGLGSLIAVSVNATNYASPQQEPQNQEQCIAIPCNTDTVCNQLPCTQPVSQQPCTPAPCNPDTVCNPAPCNPAPCNTTAGNSVNSNTYQSNQPSTNQAYQVVCGGC